MSADDSIWNYTMAEKDRLYQREYKRKRSESMTEEERQARREYYREYYRKRRASMTEAQRQACNHRQRQRNLERNLKKLKVTGDQNE